MCSLYASLRRKLQPWWKPRPKNAKVEPKGIAVEQDVNAAKDGTSGSSPAVRLVEYSKPLARAAEFKKKPAVDTIWCYHDDTHHDCFAHFAPNSGFRFTERDGAMRAKLQARVYPRLVNTPFDRTHMIPIGFHGSEKDNRLLVGWHPVDNREKFRDFEAKAKKLNKTAGIYWLCTVTKTGQGARWEYHIYDDQSMSELMSLSSELKAPFVWR